MNATVELVPGYLDAVKHEKLVRESAFVLGYQNICGFEIKPFSLRHYATLRAIGNPLLFGGTPTPLELVAFLWVVSACNWGQREPTRSFLRKCRSFLPSTGRFFIRSRSLRSIVIASELVTKLREYVTDATQDFPEQSNGNKIQKSYYSDVAWMCHYFGKHYGWHDEFTLDCPMTRLLQFYRCIREQSSLENGGRSSPMFNPSDAILGDYIKGQKL